MGLWIAVIVIAVAVAVVAVVVFLRRRRARVTVAETTPPAPARPAAPPMTDLESALAKVTDRDGRPIRERIDAESVHVDPLRDPDDTGPLLRRALDSVAHHDDEPTAEGSDPRPSDA